MAAIKDSHTIRSVVDSSGCSYLPLSEWNEDTAIAVHVSLYGFLRDKSEMIDSLGN